MDINRIGKVYMQHRRGRIVVALGCRRAMRFIALVAFMIRVYFILDMHAKHLFYLYSFFRIQIVYILFI